MTNLPAMHQEAIDRWQRGQAHMTPTGLAIPPLARITDAERVDIQEAIRSLDSISQWCIADYARIWPDHVEELAALLGKPTATLRFYSVVARNWPQHYRVPIATFSHHARIPKKLGNIEDRSEFLETWIEENEGNNSVRKLENDVARWLSLKIIDQPAATEEDPYDIGISRELISILGRGAIANSDTVRFEKDQHLITVTIEDKQGRPTLYYSMEPIP